MDVESNENATGGITGKGFKPGQSGNPGGKVKMPKELIAKCRDMTDEVLEFWIATMRDSDAKGSDRLKASENLIERGFGKTAQVVEFNGEDGNALPTISIQFIKPE